MNTADRIVGFVIPVFNERDTLEPLARSIIEHVAPHKHQILFVDDASTDGSWEILCSLHNRYPTVDVIRLGRNFGKGSALAVGFARTKGDFVFTMDSDLQDDPKEIPRLLKNIEEGYDLVIGWKVVRRDPWHKTLSSRLYNRCVACLFKLPLHDVNSGYKLLRKEVLDNIPLSQGLYRLLPVFAAYRGCRVTEIPVEHHPRRYGHSKFGLERAVSAALTLLEAALALRFGLGKQRLFRTLAPPVLTSYIAEERIH